MKTTQSDLIEMSRWLKVAALLVLILYPIWAVCFLINWFMLGHPLRSRNFGGGFHAIHHRRRPGTGLGHPLCGTVSLNVAALTVP